MRFNFDLFNTIDGFFTSREVASPNTVRSARLLFMFSIAMIAIGGPILGYELITEFDWETVIQSLLLLSVAMSLLWGRNLKNIEIVKSVVLILIFGIIGSIVWGYADGVIDFLWLPLFPFVIAYFAPRKYRFVAASLPVITILILKLYPGTYLSGFTFDEIIRVLSTYLLGSVFAFFSIYISEMYEEMLEIRIKENELTVLEHKKFKLAVDHAHDYIVISDAVGLVLYANQAAEKTTGFKLAEVLGTKAGTKWGGLMSKEYYRHMWDTISVDKKTFVGEIQNKRKNGERFDALISISPILDVANNVMFYVSIQRDITENKRIDQLKTDFINIATHQLKTPLIALGWQHEMLESMLINSEDPLKNISGDIGETIAKMKDLIETLLNITRLQSGSVEIRSELINVQDFVGSFVDSMRCFANPKELCIEYIIKDNITEVSADKSVLTEILTNFLTNAIKYSKNKASIILTVAQEDDQIVFAVHDHGIGIPQSEQDAIYTRFFRASNAMDGKIDGTGIGLYLVKILMDTVGGTTGFNSKEGESTTFWIKFPVTGMISKEGSVQLGL